MYGAVLLIATLLFPSLSDTLHWRSIGPFRGGRTVAIAGVPSQRGVFYIGAVNGGIWKTTDYGRTYDPVFDGQDTGSIGAIAVAASDPNVLYAGSGEGLRRPDLSVGDGIYKSIDAGKHWSHVGLTDAQQVAEVAVDPRDSNRVFAAVLGHPYGPNEQRGLYRSTDGGRTWAKVLGKDENTGAAMVRIDPRNRNVVYAALWASRNGPWWYQTVEQLWQDGGFYKSTDGGTTWQKLSAGLPQSNGRIGLAIAPSDSNRLYAWIGGATECGIYRSSDAGESWTKVSGGRVCGGSSDRGGLAVDPVDENTLYAANTETYRSTDGGETWTGFKGAPGGDDYHTIWIDPHDRNLIALASDQGATISVNGGRTWSSWYNQPTAQMYHVITDDRFPYRVFSGQQDSGSAEVASRSDDGAIWIRYWHPVGAIEYAYVAPDPLHPNIIYGAGAGTVSRYDENLSQTQDVSPSYSGVYRSNRTAPLIFNHVDKRTLYFGSNVLLATTNGGHSWRIISPDLTRPNPGIPPNIGAFASTPDAKAPHRGVIYSIGPSYVDPKVIWAGTDDGFMWITRDGGTHWTNVTPAALTPWSKISQIDASHFDRGTAYVAVTRFRLDDLHPYIYRTHDFGAHWKLVSNGVPPTAPVDTVREDPVRRGLLFAGTERTVYVSLDDGARWNSLQLNLPSTSIRDLVVHNDDLVVGTHGRGFWILDDIAPLRRLVTPNGAHLFSPAIAYRLRRDTWTDTPLPPEEPAGKNPPDGAMIDYWLPRNAAKVILTIADSSGNIVRRWTNHDSPAPVDEKTLSVPTYWIRPPRSLSARAGMHRFLWDYRYATPRAMSYDYPISAIVHDTPLAPQGVLALPGRYAVTLNVDGKSYRQPLDLRMDPRVTITAAALREQFDLASQIATLMNRTFARFVSATARKDSKAAQRYADANDGLSKLLDVVESADAAPTVQASEAVSKIASDTGRY